MINKLHDGDKYYFIVTSECILNTYYYNNDFDRKNIEIGNVFLTEAAAQKKINFLKVRKKLTDMPGCCNNLNDFKAYGISYWSIVYDPIEAKIDINCTMDSGFFSIAFEPNIVYFKSYRYAKEAIEKIGEDILVRDYFGVSKE